jgi:hypothetical protein
MAEKQIKVKRARAPLGIGRKARRSRYEATGRRERNKKREAENMKRHLLLAKARRFRNHPDKASEADEKAYRKLSA